MRESVMSQSRVNKIKAIHGMSSDTSASVFWMSLDEAKKAIGEKYEFLADRYEKRYRKAMVKRKP
jgi:hypothetical protein